VIFVNIVEIQRLGTTILSEESTDISLLLISYSEKLFPIQIHIMAMVRRNASIVAGFPSANRRETRKLGLLRKQKFRSRTRASEVAGTKRACLRGMPDTNARPHGQFRLSINLRKICAKDWMWGTGDRSCSPP